MTENFRKLVWGALLARLEADLARAEAGADPEQRDEAVWVELHRRVDYYAGRYARKPFPLARADLSSWELDDIVQETCVKLQRRDVVAKLRSARTPAGYLVAMLRNAAASFLRERAARPLEIWLPEILGNLVAEAPSGGQDAFGTPNVLQGVLAELSREDRELLHERYVQERPVGEIAAALGISYSAAAVRLHRLKKRLLALMEAKPSP